MYIYIYIERERERSLYIYIYIHTYIYTYMYTCGRCVSLPVAAARLQRRAAQASIATHKMPPPLSLSLPLFSLSLSLAVSIILRFLCYFPSLFLALFLVLPFLIWTRLSRPRDRASTTGPAIPVKAPKDNGIGATGSKNPLHIRTLVFLCSAWF